MPIGEICNRDTVIVKRDDTALEAAKLMRQHHVGDVVVVEERDGAQIPVGIVTDRDLVVEIMATELDPDGDHGRRHHGAGVGYSERKRGHLRGDSIYAQQDGKTVTHSE